MCPRHADIRFCPLYHASHGDAPEYGCDDGQLGTGQCAVHRGFDYDRAVAGLRVKLPGYVEEIEFREDAEARRAQHLRNIRAAGLH